MKFLSDGKLETDPESLSKFYDVMEIKELLKDENSKNSYQIIIDYYFKKESIVDIRILNDEYIKLSQYLQNRY